MRVTFNDCNTSVIKIDGLVAIRKAVSRSCGVPKVSLVLTLPHDKIELIYNNDETRDVDYKRVLDLWTD
jgi:hypothetical protein